MAYAPQQRNRNRDRNKDKDRKKRKHKGEGPSLQELARMGTRKQLRRRATGEVRWAQRPALREVKQQKRQAGRMYERDVERVGNIYDRLQAQLEPLGEQYDEQARRIIGEYGGQVGALEGLLGQAAAPEFAGEQGAAAGVLGALGAGGHTLLSSDRMRNAAYQRFAGQQAGFEGAQSERLLLQNYRDLIDELQAQRQDIKGEAPLMRMTRMGELTDESFNRQLALRESRIRARLAGKEFGLKKRAFRSEKKGERRKEKFARKEIKREREQQKRKRQRRHLNKEIQEAETRLDRIKKEIKKWEAMGNDPFARDKLEGLYNRRERLQDRLKDLKGKK